MIREADFTRDDLPSDPCLKVLLILAGILETAEAAGPVLFQRLPLARMAGGGKRKPGRPSNR
jgi:hypothetical protein